MIDQEFFNLAEAVEELGMPEHAVLRLVRNGDLPICFDADETLTGVSIQHPEGTIEYVARPIPLSGVLACHGDTADAGSVEAVGVRVLHVRSIGMGHSLPTAKSDTGFISPGHVVSGFVDFARVEMVDWLFHRDDLQAVKDGTLPASPEKNEPVAQSSDWQVRARTIADKCFDIDTANKCRDSLMGYSKRVTNELQELNIAGPRGVIGNPRTTQREALQGKKWWARKAK